MTQLIYKQIKLDVGLAFGEITHPHAGFITPYAELKFNVTNNISLGGRAEYVYFSKNDAPISSGVVYNDYWNNIESDGYIASALFTGDYYFTTLKLRPFAGAGAGFYLIDVSEKNIFIDNADKYLSPGVMLRAGVVIDHIRVGLEYNIISDNRNNLNYIALKMGLELGGGKKLFIKP
jgi:hypothetical protein